jgi:Citrate synthase, C-terminal domain
VEAAKNKKSGRRLMGFGHRVHKNYDSRAKSSKSNAMSCWQRWLICINTALECDIFIGTDRMTTSARPTMSASVPAVAADHLSYLKFL